MAVLKRKIPASTLMETLVGTVLIVVLFMVASMLLNSLFSGSIKFNTSDATEYLHELQYQYQHQQLKLPYDEERDLWQISVVREGEQTVVFRAKHLKNLKEITKTVTDVP